MNSRAIPELQRITTLYDRNEDRIRINAQLSDRDHAVTLWLTQRLLKMVIPHLLKWLNSNAPSSSGDGATEQQDLSDTTTTDRGGVTAALPLKQKKNADAAVRSGSKGGKMAAVSSDDKNTHQGQSVPPVLETHQAMLVTSVDLSSNKRVVRLVFKTETHEPASCVASLTMKATSLRAWLEIIYSQWRRGAWPEDLWPTDMKKGLLVKTYSNMSTTVH